MLLFCGPLQSPGFGVQSVCSIAFSNDKGYCSVSYCSRQGLVWGLSALLQAGLCSTSHAAIDSNYSRPVGSPPQLIRQECGCRDGVSGDATCKHIRFETCRFNLPISSISKDGSSALCWQPAKTVNAAGTVLTVVRSLTMWYDCTRGIIRTRW